MFLQIHFLTSYHASLLNRDDAGLAKRISFGGTPRLRVSSQCQKRHWREWLMLRTDLPSGVRSRNVFSRALKQRLAESGMSPETAHELLFYLANGIFKAAGQKDAVDKNTLEMKQPVLFGRPEVEYMFRLVSEAAKKGDVSAAKAYLDDVLKNAKQNFAALVKGAGLQDPAAGFEGALFGRFVTSDVLARYDAPVHVAHAFTTHALDTEVDFFTVVDDLLKDEETGAAHANDMELGAGIFYGYVAVDVPLLVSNLTGCDREDWRDRDPEAARSILNLLIHAIAEVSPGSKLGATAPYARAECVLLEVGQYQPRSLANAFLRPVRMGEKDAHPMAQSVEAMDKYLRALEQMYGPSADTRAVATLHPWAGSDESVPLQQAIDHALAAIFRG